MGRLRREFASWTEPGVDVDTDKQDLDLEFFFESQHLKAEG